MSSVTTLSAGNSSFIEFTTYINDAPVPVTISSDISINSVGERINSAMWSSGDTTLTSAEFFTQSVQMSASGEYYLDVYRANPDLTTNATEVSQFSIAYGNYAGYGGTSLEGQTNGYGPTKAIYSQYAALLEDKTDADTDFKFLLTGSVASDEIYVVNIGRNQLKERQDSGNWELQLSGSVGNVQLVDAYVGSGSNDLGDGPINIVSGSIAGGATLGDIYGKFYPNHGVMVLNAARLSGSVTSSLNNETAWAYEEATHTGGGIWTASTSPQKVNLPPFFEAIKLGNHFKARSTEHLHSRTYFCRIPSYAGNFSSNPTFVNTTLNDGTFLHPSMIGNPKTYITTVGLYDEDNELMAVAKLSKPLLKSFNREALVRVRLEY